MVENLSIAVHRTQQNSNCTITYLPSYKQSTLDEQDILDTDGERKKRGSSVDSQEHTSVDRQVKISSDLWGHRMQSKGPVKSDVR